MPTDKTSLEASLPKSATSAVESSRAHVQRRRELVEALVSLRRTRGISQAVMAARMGITKSAVAAIENNVADPGLVALGRYAEVLGYSIQCCLIPRAEADEQPAVIVF